MRSSKVRFPSSPCLFYRLHTDKFLLIRYPASHAFASALSGSDNIVSFHSKRYPSPLTVQGSGAGADVTAAGVVGDAIKVAEQHGVRIPL